MPFSRKHEIQARRREVSLLYLQGKSQLEIAGKLNITQQQVSHDLKKLREVWQHEMASNIDEAKARELAKIDNLEREYWTAWEKSKKDYEQKIVKASGSAKKANKVERTEKEMIVMGDPRFLQGVQWCIERRCKIIGIDAPERKELTGKDGTDLFEKLTDEELSKKVKEYMKVINGGTD